MTPPGSRTTAGRTCRRGWHALRAVACCGWARGRRRTVTSGRGHGATLRRGCSGVAGAPVATARSATGWGGPGTAGPPGRVTSPASPSCWACFLTSSSYSAAPVGGRADAGADLDGDLLQVRALDRREELQRRAVVAVVEVRLQVLDGLRQSPGSVQPLTMYGPVGVTAVGLRVARLPGSPRTPGTSWRRRAWRRWSSSGCRAPAGVHVVRPFVGRVVAGLGEEADVLQRRRGRSGDRADREGQHRVLGALAGRRAWQRLSRTSARRSPC